MKKDHEHLLVFAGIVLAVLLIGQTDFFGSLVTTCEDNEPSSIAALEQSIVVDLNGTMEQAPNFVLLIDGVNQSFESYETESRLGLISFSFVDNVTNCNGALAIIKYEDNASEYTRLSQTKVLLSNNDLYWCNSEANIVIKSSAITALANYHDYYNNCTTIEVEDAPATTNNNNNNGGSTTTTNNSVDNKEATPDVERDKYGDRFIVTVIAILALIVVAYYMFEKGPDKGLIRGRRR